jgi:D-3-phosphoglycerate dehydrogenase
MAARQLIDYLERGNIKNSVNLPACHLERGGGHRLVVVNKNVPNMVSQITSLLAVSKINIEDMINHHRGDFAYNIIETEQQISEVDASRIKGIDGVLRVRAIGHV